MAIVNVTLNPLDLNGVWTLSNGDLTATVAESSDGNIRATHGKVEGKWYWEVKLDSGSNSFGIGIANKLYPIASTSYSGESGDALHFRAFRASNGRRLPEATAFGTSSSLTIGDILGVALDLDNGKLEFYKNGVSMGISHTNLTGMGEVYPFFKDLNTTLKTFTVNFGATSFAYPIPSGYLAYADNGLVNKTLIRLRDEGYKYYEETGTFHYEWKNISNEPTREDFEAYGMHDLSAIPEVAWKELSLMSPTIELVNYVPTGNEPTAFSFQYEDLRKEISMNALPVGQFVINPNVVEYYGDIQSFSLDELKTNNEGTIRIALSFDNASTWEAYRNGVWVRVNPQNDIVLTGMTIEEFESITSEAIESKVLSTSIMRIGYYIEENHRKEEDVRVGESKISAISYVNNIQVNDLAFYVLNTTATINLRFSGNKLSGVLSDEDQGRVRYRVRLNNEPYYPRDGSFTNLLPSPFNINLIIDEKNTVFGQENYLQVEFEDYWGQTDTWSTTFVATYSGLMFMDSNRQYYSDTFGGILKNMDFGELIAGQTSLDQKVILRNQLGYDVENIRLEVVQPEQDGVTVEVSKEQSPFIPLSQLTYDEELATDDEVAFYVRISTTLTATPTRNGAFELRVNADKVPE